MTLTDNQRASWTSRGFLRVPGFLSETERVDLQRWVEEVAAWPDNDDAWMHHREHTPAGPRLSRSENFVPYHDGMRALLTEGRLVDMVGELLGESAVLYKEKINYKYPGGGGYAAHQDAPAYEFVDLHITCLLAVDDATPENGCLFFAPGRHVDGLLELDEVGCIDPAVATTLTWEPAELAAGDALFFSSYAPHHSPPNETDTPRRAVYLTYNALAEGDLHDAYYRDKRAAFAAAQASGEQAATHISKIGHFRGTTVLS